MNKDYKEKYEKYKQKYLNLKSTKSGGGLSSLKNNKIDNEILELYRKNTTPPKRLIKKISLDDIENYYKNKEEINEDNMKTINIKIKYNSEIKKLASITNYFVLPTRMKCLLEGQKHSPYEIYVKERNKMDFYKLKSILKKSCTLLDFTRIIYILNLLLPNKTDIKYIDSSAGWGDRLIASLLYGVSEYRGYDPNSLMTKNYSEIIKYFEKNKLFGYYGKNKKFDKDKYSVMAKPCEFDYDNEINDYFDICISSPPFFTFEKYCEEETQSIYSGKKIVDISTWLNNFLYPTFRKLLRLIKIDGYICWYLEDKPSYKFIDEFINYAKTLNCIYYAKIGFSFDDTNIIRYFLIFKKIGV